MNYFYNVQTTNVTPGLQLSMHNEIWKQYTNIHSNKSTSINVVPVSLVEAIDSFVRLTIQNNDLPKTHFKTITSILPI